MRKLSKIFLVILVVYIAIFLILSILVSSFAKKIAEAQIEQNLKIKAKIEKISLSLPLSINIDKLQIGELLSAEHISFSPNLLGMLAGKVVLSNVDISNAKVALRRLQDGTFNLPQLEKKGKAPEVYLTGIRIRNGKFTFIDEAIAEEGHEIIADQINAHAAKVMLPPTSLNVKFDLSMALVNPAGAQQGNISGSGRIDFGPKDMDANFQAKDIEITQFAPYYGDFISRKKLISAKLNLSVILTAKNNDFTSKCHLELFDLVYAKEENDQQGLPEFDLAKNALDLFTDTTGKLKLDFSLDTKLDHPQVDPATLKGIILEAAAKNLVNQRPEEVVNKVTHSIKEFEDFGKEMKDLFKHKN